MDNQKKYSSLDDIFNDEEFHLIEAEKKTSTANTPDERLLNSFEEINDFVRDNHRSPEANHQEMKEYMLHSRLEGIRKDAEKVAMLKGVDRYGLLPDLANEPEGGYNTSKPKEITSLEDILSDDDFGLLEEDTASLFEFKHTPKEDPRAQADFVAQRKPCKNFEKYEDLFKAVQYDLSQGKRKLVKFHENQLQAGNYFVHNGILLLLERINGLGKDKFGKDDGRTKVVFENGTESNMKLRSLGKNLFINGKGVTKNQDDIATELLEKFGTISDEDKEAGYIYVLRSKSQDEHIKSIKNLHKIGYSTGDIADRIKNAPQEPTYLMAEVEYIAGWKCFNMNTQKFEQLIHNFFGASCLELDVFDNKGKRHNPREWFIVPLEVIEQVVELIISGEIVKYRYEAERKTIMLR